MNNLLLLLLLAVVAITTEATAPISAMECHSPFGKDVGRRVIAANRTALAPLKAPQPFPVRVTFHSNCRGAFVSNISSSVDLTSLFPNNNNDNSFSKCDFSTFCPKRVFEGLDWQCVHGARMFSLNRWAATFESIDYAFQIYSLKTATKYVLVSSSSSSSSSTCVCKNATVAFESIPNNSTAGPPREGDLVIYSTEGPGMAPTGHVAAIVEVGSDFIRIVEENWANAPWPNPQYSRQLKMEVQHGPNGQASWWSVQDPPYQILGFKRYGDVIRV